MSSPGNGSFPRQNTICGTLSHSTSLLFDITNILTWEIFPHYMIYMVGYFPTYILLRFHHIKPAPEPPEHQESYVMLNRLENAYPDNHKRAGKCSGKFTRAFTSTVLTTGILLATATYALSAPDLDNNPPGPRCGPGTNWENPPGPRGGPGASPDVKPRRPAVRRRIYNARHLPRPHRPIRPRRRR